MKSLSRRSLLKNSTVVAGTCIVSPTAVASLLTPAATEGPYYPGPSMRLQDVDNDLVTVAGKVQQAGGEIIRLVGRISSREGVPMARHRIEIWQCDVNGKYLHPGDERPIDHDSGFQGFGHDMTDGDGNYVFRTIKPASYPGRTPHIHVKVCNDKRELLTTQFYIAGHPGNLSDGIYRRLSEEQARSVSMVFRERNGVLETTVDLII
ncbi:MAG: protocatechuate 3,4-dioxygenase [Granulosicoccus sp.]|nr:protocatechuate 3,4-dioxygenase [Granulosicoccus sp.]